ncbi:methyltransferase [Porphyromonas macacae]|uniref:class I SAM-dependent methyltransferase n=1 Tax=Porphyromonas macacae TaxID=28115 RepID=UPI00052BA3C5|nr:class I SAM-dependent methyltransferase [Porphyromonas macacae]KGN99829.1 methyltransferase [Porphyromonas macacae]
MKTNYGVGDLIYDANIYDGLNTFLDDLPFYKKWLPKSPNARILELCCGTGRLTIPIAKEGYSIYGVDNARPMLEQAKLKASKEGLKIGFIEADIRTLDLPNKYDLIFISFNSIHHLYQTQDLFDTLNVIKKHLKEDGLFLLDCFNPNIHYMVEAEKELNKIAEYTTDDDRRVVIKQIMKYERKTQINRIEWHYFINDKFHSVQNLDMRMYFPQELDTYLKWIGFTIIHKFGSFDEEIFDDDSEKQIFVCKCDR